MAQRTKITSSLIAGSAVDGSQILDGTITRADLNTTTSGSAVVTRIIPGTNINISSTGVDSGTGDVTINVAAIPAAVDYQLEGALISQRAKLNITDSSEINFTVADDVANSRVNVSATITSLDYSKLANVPPLATTTDLTNHQNNTNLHLTTTQNTLLDGITTDFTHINYLSNVTSDIQTQLNNKEPTITSGTTSQYYRGDKSWQTLDKSTVSLSNVDNTSDLDKPISTATQTALDGKVDEVSPSISGHIIPTTTQLYDIGSTTNRFRAIYVDEAHLATNTLYIGDTPILGTEAQTVNIHTDPNQSIDIRTSGTGVTTVESAKSLTLSTNGTSADVFINATGLSSNVRLSATNEVQFTANQVTFNCPVTIPSQSISGNLTVSGNLVVNGTTTSVNSTVVNITDNIINLNHGQVGSGVSLTYSGIQIDRGDLSDYQLVFDETDDFFKIGAIGSLETIATRPWVSSNYSLTSHNHSLDSLNNITISNKQIDDLLKWNGSSWVNFVLNKNFIGLSNVDNTSDVNKPISTATQSALDLKLNSSSYTAADVLSKLLTVDGTASGLDADLLDGHDSSYFQTADADLTAIANLAGTSGILTKTAANTWALDTSGYLTGNESISITGDATGSGTTSIALTLANSGVTAGTYNNSATAITPLTVDAKGRVTATGVAVTITPAWSSITSKPTTLAGYGITDATSSSHAIDQSLHLTSDQNTWLDAITATSIEVNYLSGVTSSVQTQLNSKESLSNKGIANGYVPLTSSTKIDTIYLPDSIVGQLEYQGVWNASTNTPAIPVASGTNKGHYYVTSVSGSTNIGGISDWVTGDWVVSNGSSWDKVDNTDAVSSVNGRLGVILLDKSDVGLSNVDNTSDLDKPVSTATQTALDLKLNSSAIGITVQPIDADLTAIAALVGTSGILTKTAANTWALDTNTYLTGNQSISVTGDATGSGTTSIALTLANSGVTAGTYNNSATAITPITVDAKGRITTTGVAVTVTPAWGSITSKPTTLAGYGITDAATSTHNHTLDGLSNVTITTNAAGEILKWNGTAWINNTLAEAGIQPAGSYLTANQSITVSGDATGSGTTAIALTLANSGVTAGTYNNSATAITPITVDAKGRITTTGVAVTVTPAWGSITSKPTTLAGYGITDAQASITAGTTAQYYRGDKTWVTLDKTAVGLSNVENTALSTWAGSANLTTAGALTAASLIVTGNLTVSGTTTTVNSTTVSIADPIFTLGGTVAPTVDDAKDRGIEFRWHNGTSAKVGFFGFDDSTGYLTFIPDATNTSEVFSGTQGDIQATNFRGALVGNSTTATTLATARSISMTGDVTWSIASFDGSANVTAVGTLANSGVTAGTYNNSATAITPLTIDAKGRITTTGVAVTVTPAWSSITSKPTTLAGYGITDAQASITAGTTAQYYRGDKTWASLDKTAVGLSNVENTALSTWAGSTNLTTAGALTVTKLSIDSIAISDTQTTTINSNNVDTTIAQFDKTIYRSAEVLVQITQGTNYYVSKVLITHDGTTSYNTEYGLTYNNVPLGVITSTISGNNVLIQLSGFGDATTTNLIVKTLTTSLTL